MNTITIDNNTYNSIGNYSAIGHEKPSNPE